MTNSISASEPLQMTSTLDSNFSFRNETENILFKSDSQGRSDVHAAVSKEDWHQQVLSIVVVGASGDLAKKKTYPSLLKLYEENLLSKEVIIFGYARSSKSHEELRRHLHPHLIKTGTSEHIVDSFLERCFYFSGKT